MTAVLETPPPQAEEMELAAGAPDVTPAAEVSEPLASPRLIIAAAALSGAGAAWMAGGVFRDPLARGAGVLGALIAAALLLLATRLRRPALLQGAGIPLAGALVGAALVSPSAGSGSSSIPSLVADAVRNGGILQPPIPFDPGWRFILVVLFAVATGAGASLALALNRPRLAVLAPLPVTVLTAIVQPDAAVLVSALGAMALTGTAMAVAYGAELSKTGGVSLQFERSRLVRGAALMVVLAVLLGLVSRLGLLFPNTERDYVAPPQKPQVAATPLDHTLFTVTFTGPTKLITPVRVGVLDDYDASQSAWLLPAYDTHRFIQLTPPAPIPGARPGSSITATITVDDSGGSHSIPTIPGASEVAGGGGDALQYDPQTGGLQLRDHPALPGFEYALTAPAPPTAGELRGAGPVPDAVRQFLSVPPPPPAIAALLAEAPSDPFDRMQFLRQQLYAKVTAAGTGQPIDVSVARVAQILSGGTATPYELTAAEALLTRYAGVPSRIGYGYIGGHKTATSALAIHPDNGAAWLEAYFSGYGWVDILGQPPRAQTSLSQSKTPNPAITPSDRLSLVVYVPVRVHTSLALYSVVDYWVLVALPPAVLLGLLVLLVPLGAKVWRRRRRSSWGRRHGPLARTGVAYAEMRDTAADLGIGSPSATPLAFLGSVEPDAEHEELAWLVTRSVWGDLRRDLRPADAAAAEAMARSVERRLRRAQPLLTRLLALVARTSLRSPYSDEIPNVWFTAGSPVTRLHLPRLRRRGLPRALPALAGAVIAVIVVVAGATGTGAASSPPAAPGSDTAALSRLVPPSLGVLTVQRERAAEVKYAQAGPDALVSAGQVYTLHQGPAVQGSLQVSLLKPGVSSDDRTFVSLMQTNLEASQPLVAHVPIFDGHCRCAAGYHDVPVDELSTYFHQHIWYGQLPTQRLYFWFPPGAPTLVILVVRDEIGAVAADHLALALSDYQHGTALDTVALPPLPSATGGSG
ncbi:MAG: transglutaminase-like domain-containing protein [Candidatus Dormibacteria bacterium]